MGKHVCLKDSNDHIYSSEEIHSKKKSFGRKQKKGRSKSVNDDYTSKCKKSKSNQKVRYSTHKYGNDSSDESDAGPTLAKSKRSVMDRCLVGKVPRRPGEKPGTGGGVAFFMKKETEYYEPEAISASSSKKLKKSALKKLKRKKSY